MPGRRTLTGLVVLALLGATALLTWIALDDAHDRAKRANDDLARQAAQAVSRDVTILAAGLRGGGAIVSREGNVGRAQFRQFSRSVLKGSPFLGLAWAPLLDPNERAAYESKRDRPIKRMADDGGLVPVGADVSRPFLPLSLTFPPTPARRQALGFDLFSEPTRVATIKSAIDAAEPKMTAPLDLAQTSGPGAVVYAPVFVRAVGERSVAGVLTSAISGEAVEGQLRSRIEGVGRVGISDGGEPLSAAPVDDAAEAEVEVLGRTWLVAVEHTASANLVPAFAAGVSGLALTLVASGLFWIASRRERDLTERRAAAELTSARESLLIRITEVLEHELEAEARLRGLARTLVPAAGDVCVVCEVGADGEVRRVGVAAIDERTEELVATLPEPSATSPIRAAISSREPVLYTRVSENREARRARERGIVAAAEQPSASAETLFATQERSNMIVPLVARGKVLGTISISILAKSDRPPLSREDVAFGMEVATHAAVALDNARLYEQQRDIAGILQGALLPRTLPEIAGVDVAVRHRPGKAGTEIGGDFYDLFEVSGRWMAVVGDVCGKGPEAAALTALVRHTLRATAQLGPEAAVRRVHEAIVASGENTYCTLCCAELRASPGGGLTARVATAGHPEPRVVDREGSVRRLDVTGPLVGVLERPVFGAQEVSLGEGAMLFMCSDGLPEARRDGEVFGEERLESLLAGLSDLDPTAVLERVEREVVGFVAGRQRDDLALFALKVRDRRGYPTGGRGT